MRQRLAVRLYLAEAEYRAAQRHDGSPLAVARYGAALREVLAAEAEVSQWLRDVVESGCAVQEAGRE